MKEPDLDGLTPETIGPPDLRRAAAVLLHLLADPPDLDLAALLIDEVHEHHRCRHLLRGTVHLLTGDAPQRATEERRDRLRNVVRFLSGIEAGFADLTGTIDERQPVRNVNLDNLSDEMRAYIDGIQLEAIEALHNATLGHNVAVERIVARSADPRLFAFTLSLMAGDILRETRSAAAHLARLDDAIERDTP